MRAISLFSGAGGFEIGFERAGIRTVLQAEQDPWCLSVLARHWPDVERVTDVHSVNAAVIQGWWPHGQNPVDVVFGGFPCQDVSVAGSRAGLGGARSGLWSEFARILRDLRPTWVCAENVPGLLSSAGGRDFGTILSDLDELGYGVAWAVLDARHFGVPQHRRRVFIVGCLGNPDAAAAVLAVCESGCGHPAPRSEEGQGIAASLDGCATDTGQAKTLMGRGERFNPAEDNFIVANGLRASDGHHRYSSPRGDGADNLISFSNRGNSTDGAETLRSSVSGTVRSHMRPGSNDTGGLAGVRRLTPLECERLMGWPDGWTECTADGREIPDSHRYRLCGNGVVAPVAEWIGHRIVAVNRMLQVAV